MKVTQMGLLSDDELRAIDDSHNWQTTEGRMAAYRAVIAKLQATQEPVQAGELPKLPRCKYPNMQYQRRFIGALYTADQMHAYARAALSARKPLPYNLICNAIDLADTESMKADYMLDSNDCIAVVRTMQALIEINGLEVKP